MYAIHHCFLAAPVYKTGLVCFISKSAGSRDTLTIGFLLICSGCWLHSEFCSFNLTYLFGELIAIQHHVVDPACLCCFLVASTVVYSIINHHGMASVVLDDILAFSCFVLVIGGNPFFFLPWRIWGANCIAVSYVRPRLYCFLLIQ